MSAIPHIVKKREGCSSDNWCVHYKGLYVAGKNVSHCEAGIEYASVAKAVEFTTGHGPKPEYTQKIARPCFRQEHPLTDGCAKCRFPTPEEIAAREQERKRHFDELRAKTPDRKEPYNIWFDETAPGVEFTHAEMMKRMKEVHGIDVGVTKGKRTLAMHMDGDTWFSYVYDWEIAGKKFTNSTRQNRRGEDAALWAEAGR